MTAVDAATTAILELMGPYLGTPEQIAKHGDRIKHRQTDAARKYAETAINAAIATGHLLPASAVADMRERCAKAIPDNWCDPLLTGKGAQKIPLDCGGVERLLQAVQKRIRALDLSRREGITS